MTTDDAVRATLVGAGFTESIGASTGFALYSAEPDVTVLHIQHDLSEQGRLAQLERYQQVLNKSFDVQVLYPALKVREK